VSLAILRRSDQAIDDQQTPQANFDDALGQGRPDRRAVWRQALSVGLASGAYGVSFGALATASGLSAAQACALSALMFTGGSQFALIGVLGAGGSGLAGTASAVLLGARNGLYALQVAPLLRVRGLRRVLAAQLTIDESTAVATAQRVQALGRLGFWTAGASVFVLWNVATLLGALVGGALGDPRAWGLDAAAGAAFLALVWPRLVTGSATAAAAGAVVVATATTPLLPPGLPVLVAALVAAPVLAARRPRRRDDRTGTVDR
jgi:predicted branched-subunit amino acid permease